MSAPPEGRKPKGISWESWIDRQIKEGCERGDFDDLPGKGKPLAGLDGVRDDDWWLKAKLRAERLSYLPPTLRVRKELEEAREAIAAATREDVVRGIIADINDKIRRVNRFGAEGPPSTVMPIDVEATVATWRAIREGR
ncbi:MAG: DUF1992 domain-containing protein [Actinomycetota bacterium]|nr:DUF1992 domain-containing protein [Actinomycetota bacterium]